MTREECAAALYHLIVIRGRWGGVVKSYAISNGNFDSLPYFVKELWLTKADSFSEEYYFSFKED